MAKEKSLFKKYVDALVPKLQKLVEKVNGKRQDDRTYLYKDTNILKREFKSDNKWEAAGVNTTYIAADFMAFDSPVDIKTRPTVGRANGKLPKAGIGRNLTESELTDLQTMEVQGGNEARIKKKIADDLVFCDVGLDELYEWAFLYGLYYGFVGMPDVDNPENMMVLDFRYRKQNTFGTTVKGVIDGEDIERVIEAINDNQDSLDTVWISKARLKKLRQTRWAQELVADYDDKIYDDDTTLKSPSEKKFKQVFEDEYECTLRIINRTSIFEKNGEKIKKKPFGNDRIIFTCNPVVGTFAYGQLAENRNRVPGVNYTLIDDYKLISRYSTNEPSLTEKTKGESIGAPIIEDVDQVYVLDCTRSVEGDSAAETVDTEDVYTTINGKKYTKSEVVAAFNALGVEAAISMSTTDTDIIKAINALSDEDEEKMFDGLVYYPVVSPATLNFTKAADSTGKQVTIDTNDATNLATATATTDDAWITPAISGKKVTVKVAANSEDSAPARTGTVVVTVGTKTAAITVNQAANT